MSELRAPQIENSHIDPVQLGPDLEVISTVAKASKRFVAVILGIAGGVLKHIGDNNELAIGNPPQLRSAEYSHRHTLNTLHYRRVLRCASVQHLIQLCIERSEETRLPPLVHQLRIGEPLTGPLAAARVANIRDRLEQSVGNVADCVKLDLGMVG